MRSSDSFSYQRVEVDGFPVAVARSHVAGPRARIVAVHGFGTTGYRTFRHVTSLLTDRGIELIAPDLPGFGASDAPEVVLSLDYYADVLAGLCARLNLDRPVLLGHSMGGKIAAAAAIRHADRFSALVLVNPGGFARAEHLLPFIAAHPLFHRLLQADWFYYRVLPRTVLGPIFQVDENRKQMARLRRAHIHLDLKRTGYRDRLGSLGLPCLLLWGRDDQLLPISTIRRIERCIPRMTSCVIDGAGHAPMKDQPLRFSTVLSEWIESNDAIRLKS